jgi:hypothetical protein
LTHGDETETKHTYGYWRKDMSAFDRQVGTFLVQYSPDYKKGRRTPYMRFELLQDDVGRDLEEDIWHKEDGQCGVVLG